MRIVLFIVQMQLGYMTRHWLKGTGCLMLFRFLFISPVSCLSLRNKVFLTAKRLRLTAVNSLILVAVQNPCFDIILPHLVKNIDCPCLSITFQNWEQLLNPSIQIARHHISTGQIDFFMTVALEVIDP